MNCRTLLAGCFLIFSLASPGFPSDSEPEAVKNFVMYIEEEFLNSHCAIRTREGSYVSISQGDTMREISESGEMLWQRKLSLRNSIIQYVWLDGIAETDNGYILVGATWDGYDDPTGVLVKLGTDGTVQWSKRFESQEKIRLYSVSLTGDGGYVVQGYSWASRQIVLGRFTANGDRLWSKIFDDLPFRNVFSNPVSDGIILASANSHILKLNDSGNIVWKKSLQITDFHLHSIGPSSDNGVILAGNSSSKLMLVRISSDGKVDWGAAYLMKDPWFSISSVVRTSDNGYVISGTKFTSRMGENPGGFVIKIDSKQELVFQKKFGRSDRSEYAAQIFPISDGGFVIFGQSIAESALQTLFLNVNSEGIVPGCGFFSHLQLKKVSSPVVASRSLELKTRNLALTGKTIETSSDVSTNPSSTTCP